MKTATNRKCATCKYFGLSPPKPGVRAPSYATKNHRKCTAMGMHGQRADWRAPSDWCEEWTAIPNEGKEKSNGT